MKNTTKTGLNQLVQARQNSLDLLNDISHRLESVRTVNGVEFINDSKSTDLEATILSLEGIKKPVIWVVGSSEIERDFETVQKLVRLKVKSIISFGEYRGLVQQSLATFSDSYAHYSSLEECFETISNKSRDGDAVLFSPASSSYELYDSYRDRGDHFKSIVSEL